MTSERDFVWEADLKFRIEMQETQDSQNILEKDSHSLILKLTTVTKTVRCWHKDRNTGQLNRVESERINPYFFGQ